MVKTPPEKLAAALRANLKRRKAAQAKPAPGPAKSPAGPVEKPRPGPSPKG
jgi:hypothetical protein